MADDPLNEREALIAGEVEEFLRQGGFVGEKWTAAIGVAGFHFPSDVSAERILQEVGRRLTRE